MATLGPPIVTHPETRSNGRGSREAGVRLIIAYKLAKGAVQALAALIVSTLILVGYGPHIRDVAVKLRQHVTGQWSIHVADLLLSAVAPRHIWFIACALALDSLLTLLEGYALLRGYWWGAWLIVVATSSFVPFEIDALFHAVHVGRALALVANVAIVVYLLRRALHERRERHGLSRGLRKHDG